VAALTSGTEKEKFIQERKKLKVREIGGKTGRSIWRENSRTITYWSRKHI
jgi:hypothetical protein